MNKKAFLIRLNDILTGLSEEERQRSLEYYAEVIDDRMEEGMSEEDAVAAVGAPEAIAAQILRDAGISPDPTLEPPSAQESERQKRTLYTVLIALIVLAAFWRLAGANMVAGTYETKAVAVSEEFSDISTAMSAFSLEVVPSEGRECWVEYPESKLSGCKISVKDGVLLLEETHHLAWLSAFLPSDDEEHVVRLALPEAQYSAFKANSTSGTVTLRPGLTFDVATVSSSSGGIGFYAAANAVQLSTSSGAIHVCDLELSSLAVSSVSGVTTLENLAVKGALSIRSSSANQYLWTVRAEALTCSSASGHISLTDAQADGQLYAQTTSSEITLTHCSADSIHAESVSGSLNISSSAATETFLIKSTSGNAALAECDAAAFHIETTSGDFQAQYIRASRALTADSSSGDLNFAQCDAPEISVTASSGKVNLGLITPKQFTVSSQSGHVSCPSSMGDGSCSVKTVSGSINITVEK